MSNDRKGRNSEKYDPVPATAWGDLAGYRVNQKPDRSERSETTEPKDDDSASPHQ